MGALARAVGVAFCLHLAVGLWLGARASQAPVAVLPRSTFREGPVRVSLWTPQVGARAAASTPKPRGSRRLAVDLSHKAATVFHPAAVLASEEPAGQRPSGGEAEGEGPAIATGEAPGAAETVGLSGRTLGAEEGEHALQQRLAESARRCYPEPARRFALQGAVEVAFCLRSGKLASLALQGSTGSDLLDHAARECVVQGALPLTAEGCYALPVRFERAGQ